MLEKVLKIIHQFEQIIIFILVLLMGTVVLFSTVELCIFIGKQLYHATMAPQFLLDKKELLKIFELFFTVLISLELFETVRLYLKEDVFHAEYILLVALIAITRKVIILEYENVSPWILMSVGVLIFVLAVGFYFLKSGQSKQKILKQKKEQ